MTYDNDPMTVADICAWWKCSRHVVVCAKRLGFRMLGGRTTKTAWVKFIEKHPHPTGEVARNRKSGVGGA